MPAYVLVEPEVHDPERYEEYRRLAPPTLKPFGGRYLVRGGPVTVLEGDWEPRRVVVLEFPDADAARAWWSCDAYEQIKPIRHATANSRMLLVEGITTPP